MKLFRTEYPLTSSFDIVSISIKLLRENIWAVFYLLALPALMTSVGGVILAAHTSQSGMVDWNTTAQLGGLLLLLGVILSLMTSPGAALMQVAAVRGGRLEAGEAFRQGLRFILPIIAMNILVVLAVIAGFIAFIFPAFILMRSFYLGQFYVVDRSFGPLKALRQSRADSKPNAGFIWGIIGVTMLFSFACIFGRIIPVVGYLLSILASLLYSFAPAFRYNEITNLKLPDVDAPAPTRARKR